MGKYTGISAERAVPENIDNPAITPITKRPPITTQVIIGTPGTIKKWISLKKLSLVYMKILVFDEADHMLAEVNYDFLTIVFISFCWVILLKKSAFSPSQMRGVGWTWWLINSLMVKNYRV